MKKRVKGDKNSKNNRVKEGNTYRDDLNSKCLHRYTPGLKSKKKKTKKTDGLGPFEKQKIRNAVRLVWHRSLARKLVVDRCTDKEGFTRCEKCRKRTPKFKVDHIVEAGKVDSGFIRRMFVSSKKLMGLCKRCHDIKTKAERAAKRKDPF